MYLKRSKDGKDIMVSCLFGGSTKSFRNWCQSLVLKSGCKLCPLSYGDVVGYSSIIILKGGTALYLIDEEET